MSYKIKFFLSLCFIGSIKSSDFGTSCSSDEFQDIDNRSNQAAVASALIRSAESTSPKERTDISMQVHKVEQEINEFQRDLRRKASGLQCEYEDLTKDPKFLTSKRFVEKKVNSFINKVTEDEQKDQEKFNALSKKVSSLRGSFYARPKEVEENPIDSLIGSLRVVAREHGFTEDSFLQVPSLKLNDSKLFLKPEQENKHASILSIACNLGSGIRQAESTTDEQHMVTNSIKVKTKNNCFTLQEDYVDGTFLDEDNDINSDHQDRSKSNQSFDDEKKSSNDSLASLKNKSKKMNDDDSDYE